MSFKCEICEGHYHQIYEGPIRDGAYGGIKASSVIYECSDCKVQRLREEDCIPDVFYQTGEYREFLKQSLESKKAMKEQEELQDYTLEVLAPHSLKDSNILDIGCGAGTLLNRLKNITLNQIGIEPCLPYYESLTRKGFKIYPSLKEAIKDQAPVADFGFSIAVIEHVKNPVEFLKQIKKLINPDGGKLVISTPNRNDILMNILKEKILSFFYRTQHRWYFDEYSLNKCIRLAGFKVNRLRYIHKYGLSNTLFWLRDGKPNGRLAMKGINDNHDKKWRALLEESKQSDYIYMELEIET